MTSIAGLLLPDCGPKPDSTAHNSCFTILPQEVCSKAEDWIGAKPFHKTSNSLRCAIKCFFLSRTAKSVLRNGSQLEREAFHCRTSYTHPTLQFATPPNKH